MTAVGPVILLRQYPGDKYWDWKPVLRHKLIVLIQKGELGSGNEKPGLQY